MAFFRACMRSCLHWPASAAQPRLGSADAVRLTDCYNVRNFAKKLYLAANFDENISSGMLLEAHCQVLLSICLLSDFGV